MGVFLILVGLLFLAPFWLPHMVGGQSVYHYVVTGSMTGAVDRGSLVVLWPQERYAVGDVVGFWKRVGDRRIPILHRVIGVTPEGWYLIKGDVTAPVDRVPPEDVIGKMVVGIPYLGHLGGAARVFPLLLAFFALAPFLAGRKGRDGRPASLFLPTAFVVLAAMPLASLGLAERMGKPLATLLMLGILGAARILEMTWREEAGPLIEVLYITTGVAALSMVYIPEVIQQVRAVLAP